LRERASAALAIVMLSLGLCVVCWSVEPTYGQTTAKIQGTLNCGSKSGCGSVGYQDPIDVPGSVRAHRTDASAVDVNASFTAADHGAFQLEVPPGTYDLYGAAVGYQTAFLGTVKVFTGTIYFSGSLMPCPSSGCVPVPEFALQIINVFVILATFSITMLATRKMPH